MNRGRLLVLGALYFSQGLPFGFFTQALPVVMRERGASLEDIGLATLLALPWALKFLWAPLVDRTSFGRFGRRKSWIIPLQVLSIAVLAAVAFAAPASLRLIMLAVLVLNLLSATQDIATDGLAVELLARNERGLANGLQVGAYRFGMIVGGGVLLVLNATLGWAGTFGTMAVLVALATLPLLPIVEPRGVGDLGAPVQREPHFLKTPRAWAVLALIVTYKVGDAFATAMLRPWLVDLGWSLSEVGWLLGTVGFVAGLFGALAGGALVNRLGRQRSLVVFGWLQALTVGGYAWMAATRPGPAWISLLCAAEHFAGGMATAALFTCMMDWSRKSSSGTDYTVQASAVVIATGVAASLSGFSAGKLGYPAHFLLATALSAASMLAVARLRLGRLGGPVDALPSPRNDRERGSRGASNDVAARIATASDIQASRTAVYAGSFDPITHGHLSVIERAAPAFGKLLVLVAVNPDKKYLFTSEERVAFVREVTRHLPNVDVEFTSGLVVDFARERGAGFLVRGLRDTRDFEAELKLAALNQSLAPELTTIFVPADPELAKVSSSDAKAIAARRGELGGVVPPSVAEALRLRSGMSGAEL